MRKVLLIKVIILDQKSFEQETPSKWLPSKAVSVSSLGPLASRSGMELAAF